MNLRKILLITSGSLMAIGIIAMFSGLYWLWQITPSQHVTLYNSTDIAWIVRPDNPQGLSIFGAPFLFIGTLMGIYTIYNIPSSSDNPTRSKTDET